MSEQLYLANDVADATGRSINNINHYMLKANVGNICGKYRVLTENEYTEMCRLDRVAKEQKAGYGPLVVGFFSNRREPFPYVTIDKAAHDNGVSTTLVGRWIAAGKVSVNTAGGKSSKSTLYLLDTENQAKVKQLADEAKARYDSLHRRVPFSLTKDAPGQAHIAIDPSMIKFSITREGAKQLLEYLKQQLGEN